MKTVRIGLAILVVILGGTIGANQINQPSNFHVALGLLEIFLALVVAFFLIKPNLKK